MAVAFGPMGIHDALILGLDPGRDKIGFAAVALTKELLFSGVFPAKELGALLEKVGRCGSAWRRGRAGRRGPSSWGMALVVMS